MVSKPMKACIILVLVVWGIVMMPPRAAYAGGELRSVPKAVCGSGDRTESVQGETTLAERFAPGPSKPYTCNLELVGQFEGEGTGFTMIAYDNCAYYSTGYTANSHPGMRHPGVAVIDVSDPKRPRATSYLTTPAMLGANESLAVESSRKLLLANDVDGTTFDVYDLSADCRHPVLKSSMSLPRIQSHSGQFAPDGRTFYGASDGEYNNCATCGASDPNAPPSAAVFAIDVSDPLHLRGIATWIPPKGEWKTHSVSVNRDGTRAYVVLWRNIGQQASAKDSNGLVILDISDIQARKPNPQFRLVSTLFWDDTYLSQFSIPVSIQHKSYLIWTDLVGSVIGSNGFDASPAASACASGRPNYGFARVIDIQDEKNPGTASKLMLEVADPANCAKVIHDPTMWFGYGSEGCGVDNPENAKLLACGFWEAGLRVFDIRDPVHPKEIAYYKPPARRTQLRPGAAVRVSQSDAPAFPKDHTADAVIAPQFRKNGQEIWFNSLDNGFQVVQFTDQFKASHSDLFRDK